MPTARRYRLHGGTVALASVEGGREEGSQKDVFLVRNNVSVELL